MRRKARIENEERVKLFYSRHPRAKEINTLLSQTAINIAKAVLKGANVKESLKSLKETNQKLQLELQEILISAKMPLNYLDIKYNCPKCKDYGYIDGMMCSCMKKLLRNEAYERLNRLSPLSLSTFDHFCLDYYSTVPIKEKGPSPRKRMNDIYNFCKRYSENFSLESPSLLMQGATGLGKTHLSLAIAKVAIDKGFGVIYGSTPNIIMKLEKERFSYNKETIFTDSENHLISCDLLILDDLGTEFSTSFSSSTIYNIINSRIMSLKPTIISTNLSMKDLERSYSERLVSRIMGHHIRLEFLGNDIRQKRSVRQY